MVLKLQLDQYFYNKIIIKFEMRNHYLVESLAYNISSYTSQHCYKKQILAGPSMEQSPKQTINVRFGDCKNESINANVYVAE